MIEICIKVSNEEQTYTQRFGLEKEEEAPKLSRDDPILGQMVKETMTNFAGSVDECLVKIKFVW
jgi:hypothetical protein